MEDPSNSRLLTDPMSLSVKQELSPSKPINTSQQSSVIDSSASPSAVPSSSQSPFTSLSLLTTAPELLSPPHPKGEPLESSPNKRKYEEDSVHFTSDENSSVEGSPTKTPKVSPSKDRQKKVEQEKDKGDDESGAQGMSKREKQEEDRMKMQVLVSNFSEEQLNRYEMFRRAAFPKAAIKRMMQSITGAGVAQNVVIAMSGISKVFVGEIVEAALDVMQQWGDTGPLQPKHIREAVRRMKHNGTIPNSKYQPKLFR